MNAKKIAKATLILAKIKMLSEENFHFAHYVADFDDVNYCGTVCCVAGWFPKWFPESGLVWGEMRNYGFSLIGEDWEIKEIIEDFTGFSKEELLYLFYGEHFDRWNLLDISSTLSEVISEWQRMIEHWKEEDKTESHV